MTYNPDVPQPNDKLSVSQADLLENFTQLNTQFAVNHYEFDDTSGDVGKHRFVSLVEQADDPSTEADEYALYAKESDSATELFARPEDNGTAFQVTKAGSLFIGALPVAAVNFDYDGNKQGSDLNVSGVTRDSGSSYTLTFTNALPDNNYFWSISGFDSSANPVLGNVQPIAYNSAVTTTTFKFYFANQTASPLSSMTRACVVIWRYQ